MNKAESHLIRGQSFYLRIFTVFLMSGVKSAYCFYKKLLRTANNKKFRNPLTYIYIFLGPDVILLFKKIYINNKFKIKN